MSSSMAVHYSSKKCEWETPQAFFDSLCVEFAFETDVCALPENAKCSRFFTPEDDGLAQEWTGICWMNPPYGREMPSWIQKAYPLLPARRDRRMPYPGSHRHCRLARLLHQGGDPLPSRPTQVRRPQRLRTVSKCTRHLPSRGARMSDHRVLVVCEDKRSHAALAREFSAYLHLSASAVAHATTVYEAVLLLEQGNFACVVIVSEAESERERSEMERLSRVIACPFVFVNLRPNHFTDASLHAPTCTVLPGSGHSRRPGAQGCEALPANSEGHAESWRGVAMKHVVGFSGGIDSQACARWVLNRFPAEDVILLNSTAGANEHPLTTAFVAEYSEKIHPVVVIEAIVADVNRPGPLKGGR